MSTRSTFFLSMLLTLSLSQGALAECKVGSFNYERCKWDETQEFLRQATEKQDRLTKPGREADPQRNQVPAPLESCTTSDKACQLRRERRDSSCSFGGCR